MDHRFEDHSRCTSLPAFSKRKQRFQKWHGDIDNYHKLLSQLLNLQVEVVFMQITKISTRNNIHSVSKEMHYEFIDSPCDPGSRSSAPGGVIFDHGNVKQVAKNPIRKCRTVLPILWKVQGYVIFCKTAQIPLQSMQIWYSTKFIYLHSSQKETQLFTVRFFWDWVYCGLHTTSFTLV